MYTPASDGDVGTDTSSFLCVGSEVRADPRFLVNEFFKTIAPMLILRLLKQ